MPSFLGEYAGCAKDRDDKFIRAVESYMAQDYRDKFMVVVADGCSRTSEILLSVFKDRVMENNIYLIELEKQSHLSGTVRQVGVNFAAIDLCADVITYLDTDDYLLPTHLSAIYGSFKLNRDCEWIWYNDRLKQGNKVRTALFQKSKIGTSNIAHKGSVPIVWGDGYAHDWQAIVSIKGYKNMKVKLDSYVVCHIPNQFDL